MSASRPLGWRTSPLRPWKCRIVGCNCHIGSCRFLLQTCEVACTHYCMSLLVARSSLSYAMGLCSQLLRTKLKTAHDGAVDKLLQYE